MKIGTIKRGSGPGFSIGRRIETDMLLRTHNISLVDGKKYAVNPANSGLNQFIGCFHKNYLVRPWIKGLASQEAVKLSAYNEKALSIVPSKITDETMGSFGGYEEGIIWRCGAPRTAGEFRQMLVGRTAVLGEEDLVPKYGARQEEVLNAVHMLLGGNVNGWNSFIKKWDGAKVDLTGVDLSYKNLATAVFRNSILNKASFERAFLLNSDFAGAVMAGANLSGAQAIEANFDGAVMTGADLTDACLYKSTFRRARLSRATLDGAQASRADMSEAILSGSNLNGTNFFKSNLSFATMHRVFLDQMNKGMFLTADLSGADFSGHIRLSDDLAQKLKERGAIGIYVDS